MSKPSDNKSFMVKDPNKDIPVRQMSTWDIPMDASKEQKLYHDTMSLDIGAIHRRVRDYIMSEN